MITLLTGENSYEIEQALARLRANFNGEPEKFDGENIELRQLPDLLMGMSLFAEKRLVIIRGLASNKQAWEALPDLLQTMSEDIHVVLVEASPDKRTKTYKALQKAADVKEFHVWGERESAQAQRWLADEARTLGVELDAAAAKELIKRSLRISPKGQPIIDQWTAKHAFDKLSVLGSITVEAVREYIEDQPVENAFSILETALNGNVAELHRTIKEIEPTEDPFRVFGLLSAQAFQMAVLAVGDRSQDEMAKAIGAHPFVIRKLAPLAQRVGKAGTTKVITVLSEADEAMKLSKATPWILIEQALMKIAAERSR